MINTHNKNVTAVNNGPAGNTTLHQISAHKSAQEEESAEGAQVSKGKVSSAFPSSPAWAFEGRGLQSGGDTDLDVFTDTVLGGRSLDSLMGWAQTRQKAR